MRLHGYFRSTASWRVRIALNLKGVRAEHVFHHLRRGAQQSPEYVRLDPQGLVPTLETDDNRIITQSLAICEWLDETLPQPPIPSRKSLRASKNTCVCAGDGRRHPYCSELESSGEIALNVDTRRRCHSVGSLGHQGWTCCLRKAAQFSARSILLWFAPNSRRHLPRVPALQRPPLWLRSIRIAAFVSGRSRLPRPACFCECLARASDRR